MRSSLAGSHISGAERLSDTLELPQLTAAMTSRALCHDKGVADNIHITVEKIESDAVATVPALEPVQTDNASPESAQALVTTLLKDAGITAAEQAVALAYSLTGLRGAALVDAVKHPASDCVKDHFHEAIILASKVATTPGILAEICLSDDPHYTKGYVAVDGKFYRVPNIKPEGSDLGTRIFVVKPGTDVDELISNLEDTPVRVDLASIAAGTAPLPVRDSITTVAARRNDQWASQGLSRSLRTFESAQLPHSRVDGSDYLLFSSSDYLGLSTNDSVIEAAVRATRRLGTGSGGSRLTTGTSIHSALERKLAEFFGFGDAVLFATGYQANHSTIAAIAGADVEIFSDSDNHASIIDGCRSARARVTIFPHADYDVLARLLDASIARHKLVISDAVFSMSGEVIDGRRLESICRERGAWLMLDDAHGVGVLGEHGRGTCDELGISPDILVGTASKALGVEGGYVLCASPVATLLRNQARSFVYSTAMNPGSVAAIDAALDQLRGGIVGKRLRVNIAAVRAALGLPGDPVASAIIPIPIGEERRAMEIADALNERGIFIPAIRYPTVPRDQAMLRLTVTAKHSDNDIARLAQALREVGVLS